MDFEYLLPAYGYAAVLVGTFFEGETILVLGGFAAHRGYLQLPWVMLAAFAGTLAGDQLYFHIGRTRGARLLERRPGWRRKAGRVLALLDRHPALFIIGFRFVYGMRTVSPFAIGMSSVSRGRFTVLNATGAALWAVSVGTLGYVFGHAMELALEEVKRYELWILAGIAACGVLIWGLRKLRERD
jgi:membrane protein DedA with SNARE-associated domain